MSLNELYIEINNGVETALRTSEFKLDTNTTGPLSVFTTFLLESLDRKAVIYCFKQHLIRVFSHATQARIFNQNFPEHNLEWLKDLLLSKLRTLPPFESSEKYLVRIILKLTGAILTVAPYTPPWEIGAEIEAISYKINRIQPELKSTYLEASRLAHQAALKANAHEAVLIDENGYLREGAWSNVFWYDARGQLYTPATSVLAGVTRDLIIKSEPVTVRDILFVDFIKDARAVFISKSTTGLSQLSKIDGHSMLHPKLNVRTQKLLESFENTRRSHAFSLNEGTQA